MNDRPVFSTDKKVSLASEKIKDSHTKLSDGPARIRLEKNGRGGKMVTLIYDLPMTEAEANELRQKLQNQLGCGGTFKNGAIELRGDVREKARAYFANLGIKLIASGG